MSWNYCDISGGKSVSVQISIRSWWITFHMDIGESTACWSTLERDLRMDAEFQLFEHPRSQMSIMPRWRMLTKVGPDKDELTKSEIWSDLVLLLMDVGKNSNSEGSCTDVGSMFQNVDEHLDRSVLRQQYWRSEVKLTEWVSLIYRQSASFLSLHQKKLDQIRNDQAENNRKTAIKSKNRRGDV